MPSSSRRPDERNPLELRPFNTQQAILKQPDGSAKFSAGTRTSVLVSVHGPAEAPLKDELMDRALVSVSFNPLTGRPGIMHTFYERLLTDVANYVILTKLHPRTVIDINVQVLADDGAILSCAVNALQLALIDASIPMKGMVASATCCFDSESNLFLDPVQEEIDAAQSVHFIVADQDANVVVADSVGWINTDDV
ncbi:MAG: hypothetical protein SGCHY_000602 [Lobulomycetales sp.]